MDSGSAARSSAWPDDASIPYLLALLSRVLRADVCPHARIGDLSHRADICGRSDRRPGGRRLEWPGRAHAQRRSRLSLHIMVWGLFSATSKQRAIAARGVRADRLIQSLLAQVPPDIRDTTVWLVFPSEGPRYSTFVLGDEFLIQPEGPAQFASEWFWPARSIRLRHVIGPGVPDRSRTLTSSCAGPHRRQISLAAAKFLPDATAGPTKSGQVAVDDGRLTRQPNL